MLLLDNGRVYFSTGITTLFSSGALKMVAYSLMEIKQSLFFPGEHTPLTFLFKDAQ